MSRPHPMGEVRKHLMLFNTMAAETGADTVLAFDEGKLNHQSWSEAITRCRNCAWTEGCQTWLAQQAERPRSVPDTCANAQMLRGLALPE